MCANELYIFIIYNTKLIFVRIKEQTAHFVQFALVAKAINEIKGSYRDKILLDIKANTLTCTRISSFSLQTPLPDQNELQTGLTKSQYLHSDLNYTWLKVKK